MKESNMSLFKRRIKTKRYRVFLAKRFTALLVLFIIILALFCGCVKLFNKKESSQHSEIKNAETFIPEIAAKTLTIEETIKPEIKTDIVTLTNNDSEVRADPVFLGVFKATAYCSCEKCCGEWATKRPKDESGNDIVYGASGEILQAGVSIAVDPSVISYGSKVEINGHEYIAHDCGGAIKGNRIDVYFDNHEEALQFGVQSVDVFLVGG